MTGPPDQPIRAGASIVDILGAVFGVTGALAALRQRDITGIGQRVGSSLFESAAFMMASHIAGGASMGEKVPPMTARKGAWGVYDVFKSMDNEPLFIGVTSDAQWERFCVEFGLDELGADERLASNPQRTLAREWLLPKLTSYFATIPLTRMVQGCRQSDVSWSPVGRPEDLLTNEQLQVPGGLLDVALHSVASAAGKEEVSESPGLSQVPLPALPLEFGDERLRAGLTRQPPSLGEHTREILQEYNFSKTAIDQLIKGEVAV